MGNPDLFDELNKDLQGVADSETKPAPPRKKVAPVGVPKKAVKKAPPEEKVVDQVSAKRAAKKAKTETPADPDAVTGETPTDTKGLSLPPTKQIVMPKYDLKATGLEIKGNISFEQWLAIGEDLRDQTQQLRTEGDELERRAMSKQWQWGAWMSYGEKKFHDKAAQGENVIAPGETGYATRSLYAFSSVYQQYKADEIYPPETLSYGHHAAAAYLFDEEKDGKGTGRTIRAALLRRAIDEKLSVADVKAEVKRLQGKEKPAKTKLLKATDDAYDEVLDIECRMVGDGIFPEGNASIDAYRTFFKSMTKQQAKETKFRVRVFLQNESGVEDDDDL